MASAGGDTDLLLIIMNFKKMRPCTIEHHRPASVVQACEILICRNVRERAELGVTHTLTIISDGWLTSQLRHGSRMFPAVNWRTLLAKVKASDSWMEGMGVGGSFVHWASEKLLDRMARWLFYRQSDVLHRCCS